MNPRPGHTLEPDYFERVYARGADPWSFATSEYERAKYADTLAALPRPPYRRGLEIGCSIGVLTAQLARRCRALEALDVHEGALADARRRSAGLPHVRFHRMMFPREAPGGTFDLAVVSEVAYYWGGGEFDAALALLLERLEDGGHLVLVHYTPEETDYPLTGDEVHERFLATPGLRHLRGHRASRYRLDVFERALERPDGGG